jgi:hypothetical protein
MKPQKFVTFHAKGTKAFGEFTNNDWLKTFQGIVGGYVEPVYLEKYGLIMWGNEEARLLNHVNDKGETVDGLPFNALATSLVAANHFPIPCIDMLGDVAFTSIKTTSAGNTLGVTDEQFEFLMSYDKQATDSGNRDSHFVIMSVE